MEWVKRSHIVRATLIAGIGALITVLLSVLIGWLLYQPEKAQPTLAQKVVDSRTVFFLRTTDSSVAQNAFNTWIDNAPIIGEASATLQGYELAILRNATGSALSWRMETRALGDQSGTSTQSSDDTDIATGSSTTTVGDRTIPLASSSFFRLHAPPLSDSGANLAYMQLNDLPPILNLSTKPVVRALLRPFSDAMLIWKAEQNRTEVRGAAWLKPKSPLRYATTVLIDDRDRQEEGSGTILAVHTSHPSQLLETFQRNLTEEDPTFAEGFKGILQAKLRGLTERTDLDQARKDLLADTAYLQIGTPVEGRRSFLFSGHGRNDAVLNQWMERTTAAATPGVVRLLPLSHGNRRIDISADDPSLILRRPDGWIIRTIGGDASPDLLIATRGNAYVISNDALWLETFLTNGMQIRAAKTEYGFVNIDAFRKYLHDAFPILSDTLPSPPFGQNGQLRWSMRTTPGSVAIEWSWTKDQFPMSNVQIMPIDQ